jgi:hypothetical protein
MAATLNVYYDTRLAPVTFDFASYLVIADVERQKLGLNSLAINLIRPAFRNKTLREQIYDDEIKEWRFNHIIIPLTNILPSITSVFWSKKGLNTINLPSFPLTYPPRTNSELKNSIPYLSNALIKYKEKNYDFLPYVAKKQAIEIVTSLINKDKDNDKIITISLRTSNQQIERNSNLEIWYKVYKVLSQLGYDVYVIPDFEDFTSDKKYLKYDWKIFLPAMLDMNLRMAIYALSKMNLGVLNGVLVPLFHSKYPYTIFKPNVETIHQTTKIWLKDIFGIERDEPFWWAKSNQFLSWETDENLDKMIIVITNNIKYE